MQLLDIGFWTTTHFMGTIITIITLFRWWILWEYRVKVAYGDKIGRINEPEAEKIYQSMKRRNEQDRLYRPEAEKSDETIRAEADALTAYLFRLRGEEPRRFTALRGLSALIDFACLVFVLLFYLEVGASWVLAHLLTSVTFLTLESIRQLVVHLRIRQDQSMLNLSESAILQQSSP